MQEKVPHMMAANISDGKLLCVSKLIPTDENVIFTENLQLLLSSPITLYRELGRHLHWLASSDLPLS